MSDQFGPDDDQVGATPPPPPPPPPTAPQPLEPDLTLDTEAEVTSSTAKSGIGGRVVAGIVGVALLVGGTVFAVTQLGSSGPGSAEEAVSQLLDAAGDEDLLGVMASLDPGERDALRGPVEDMFGELERLEVLDESFELGGVEGIDLEFADVTFRSEPVRDDLTRVYLTGGTVTTSVDTDELPIGAFVTDTVERFGGEVGGFQQSETADIFEDGNDEVFLVARNGSDGWRVSIGYTIAEAARLDAGQPLPTSVIEPVGADSPEAAVEGMLGAFTELDIRDALARLSPNEFAALHEYADLFLGPAESELEAVRDEFTITVDDLQLRSDSSGDTATVFVDSMAFTFEAEGESFSMSVDQDCVSIEGDVEELELEGTPFADGPVCTEELEQFSNDMLDEMGFGDMQEELDFPEIETPEFGITTHRVDGEWFVAPIATSFDAVVSGLQVLERSHLDAMVDLVESFFLGFEESFAEFDEIGDSIGGDPFTPTTTFDPDGGQVFVDEQALDEFLLAYAGDEATAACLWAELLPYGDVILAELADSYTFDFEPSLEAQDAFFAASDACL